MSRQSAVSEDYEGFHYQNNGGDTTAFKQEPEGMTYFPTTKSKTPNISGSRHVLLLTNGSNDTWYFKHYSEV